MTASASTVVELDAGMVYADGVYNGLKMAVQILSRTSGAQVPFSLRRAVTEWECNVIHREWLAMQGRPVAHEQSAVALSVIHAVINATGLKVPPHVE